MKNASISVLLIISFNTGMAQNLILNGDFEQYSGCPNAGGGMWGGQLDSALFWMNPAPWPPGGSPDYFHQCNTGNLNVPNTGYGYQPAHSGVAFCGIGLWSLTNPEFREYIEAPITTMLLENACYHFEMYVSSMNGMQYVTDAIQVYFSDTAITGINNWFVLPYSPHIINTTGNIQDTLNWVLVSGNYIANGGEQFMLIGNFNNDANTNTVLFNPGGQWTDVAIYIDDVSLTPCTGINESSPAIVISAFPNPFTSSFKIRINNNDLSEFILYDIASKKILQENFTNSISINTVHLSKGVFIYEIRNKTGLIGKGKILKD